MADIASDVRPEVPCASGRVPRAGQQARPPSAAVANGRRDVDATARMRRAWLSDRTGARQVVAFGNSADKYPSRIGASQQAEPRRQHRDRPNAFGAPLRRGWHESRPHAAAMSSAWRAGLNLRASTGGSRRSTIVVHAEATSAKGGNDDRLQDW